MVPEESDSEDSRTVQNDTVQDGNEQYDTVQDGMEQYGTVQDQMAEEDTEEVGESVTRRSGRRIKKPELYREWKYGET